MTVRAVCFDLDDTLCTYNRSGSEVLAAAFERTGVEPFFSYTDYESRFDAFRNAPGAETLADVRERCFVSLARDAGYEPTVGRTVATAYDRERDPTDVSLLSGAREAVTWPGPTGLITNGPPDVQRPKLETIGLVDAFDVTVYAGHDVPAKPAAEPFEKALAGLDAAASETAHVGNNPVTDVAGANRAGLTSVWVADGMAADGGDDDVDYDYRIATLQRFPPW